MDDRSAFDPDATFLTRLLHDDPEFRDLTHNALRTASACLAAAFALFVLIGLTDQEFDGISHPVIVTTDIVTTIFFTAIYLLLRSKQIPKKYTYWTVALFAGLSLANTLLAFYITENAFFLSYVPMIAVGCAAFVLSLPWLLSIFVMIYAISFVVATEVIPVESALRYSPVLLGSYFISLLFFFVRRGHVIQSQRAIRAMEAESQVRQRAEENLAHAQRLESIGKLVSGIAHDFNNLLMVILGYTDNILATHQVSEASRKDLEAIRKAGDSAAALASKLLAFSRQQVLNLEATDVNQLIFETKPLIEKSLPSSVELVLSLHADKSTAEVDALQMQQVLINLALNARDAMSEDGGALTIETLNEVSPISDDTIVIKVSDTGIGMPPQVRERIFEPFYTTKPSSEGTGLGLAMVHGIITQIGGEISVSTSEGRGSTFKISLAPLDSAGEQLKTPTPAEPKPRSLDEMTVLLVDDEAGVRTILTRILEESVHSVVTASSAEEALAFVENTDFDILVTDVVMPGLSGVELINALREKGFFQPAILMSGYVNEELSSNTQHLRLLNKPFRGEELIEALQESIDSVRTRPNHWKLSNSGASYSGV